jgi:hypothetical protein
LQRCNTRLWMISHGHPVIYLPEIPKKLHSQRERGRLQAQGHRAEDNTGCTLLVIHQTDSSWAIHGLGAPGVRLPKAEMIALADDSGACPVSWSVSRHRAAGRHRRGVTHRPMPSAHQHRLIRIVDARTSMEHLVTDESVVAHRHAGRYLAVCGAQVLAASLTAPQRSWCSACTRGVR